MFAPVTLTGSGRQVGCHTQACCFSQRPPIPRRRAEGVALSPFKADCRKEGLRTSARWNTSSRGSTRSLGLYAPACCSRRSRSPDPISWTGKLCGVRLSEWSVEGDAGARRPRYERRSSMRVAAECPRREIGTASPAARSVDAAERWSRGGTRRHGSRTWRPQRKLQEPRSPGRAGCTTPARATIAGAITTGRASPRAWRSNAAGLR